MLRYLIKNFQKTLILTKSIPTESNPQFTNLFLRTLTTNLTTTTQNEEPTTSSTTTATTQNPLDTDEYIVPYPADRESRRKNNIYVLGALRKKFHLSEADIEKVLSDEAVQLSYREKFLTTSLEILINYGIVKQTFLECPWLITMQPKRLEVKLQELETMKLRDINDFAPLLRLNATRFKRLMISLKRESKYIPHGNRIYYISDKLNLPAFTVAKYLSKRLFILEMPFDTLDKNLHHMLNYNVSPWNIIRDLWAFRYTPKSVENRLERAKLAKKDKIMPWMVRCPENILQRSFQLSIDEDKILEGKDSAVAYVAERLGFSVPVTQAIMNKHPAVLKVRVPKIKEVLDYLLDEEGFTRHEVAQVPRILCHSLDTTKERIAELKSVGCRMSSLVIVCKSKREYAKFLNKWIDIRDKIELRKELENKN
ncbi:transcription termination factor, mitochondrial [Episyrphus balteatus]|uniref:transcription termination factor, mitochondrial n=1 Tax=Episyrphus balteatus TaxID=286459 RepID=UPI002486A369|nr:transcription termination factor, mitochondrial [Episyrphus balteatus]